MKTKTLLKIIIPVLIVAVIATIFIVKNSGDSGESTPPTTDAQFPLNLTSVNLEEIKQYGVPTVIDFGADSCIPCKEMAPVLKKLNAEWQGRAAVQFLDVWKYNEGVEDFPVQSIPTQVFFTADGKPFEPSEKLAKQIQFQQYSYNDSGELAFTVHIGGLTEEQMRLIFAEMGVE